MVMESTTATTTQANFPLPTELRIVVLSHLLVADPYAPLHFNPLRGTKGRDLEVIRIFFILTRVSRAVREETHEVFFSRNRFQFRTLKYVSTGNIRNTQDSTLQYEVAEPWIKRAALRMTDIRLHVHGRNSNSPTQVRELLKCTTKILEESTNLRRLHVDFLNRMIFFYDEELERREPGRHLYGLIAASGRKEHQPRDRAVMKAWPGMEVEALEPLVKLRRLEHACVVGSVTNRWALYLESCMKTPSGTSVPDYEPGEEIPDPRWLDESNPTSKGVVVLIPRWES